MFNINLNFESYCWGNVVIFVVKVEGESNTVPVHLLVCMGSRFSFSFLTSATDGGE